MVSMFSDVLEGKYVPTDQLDQLTEGEGEPHLAVIHIDGNGIGRLLKDSTAGPGDDQSVAERVRRFSAAVTQAANTALRETMRWAGEIAPTVLDLQKDGNLSVFPVRPVVFGGDDLTLVSNGKIGLQLAARYLEALSSQEVGFTHRLSACAGVAIVRSHFPFSRAYSLADELCHRAKKQLGEEPDTAWLDFQVVMSGATGGLELIRRAYLVDGDSLLWRPWRVFPDGQSDSHDWSLMVDMVQAFAQWPRWRVKELRDVYQLRGADGVRETLSQYESRGIEPMPKLHQFDPHAGGFSGSRTAFVDGLEAEEFLVFPEANPVPSGDQQ